MMGKFQILNNKKQISSKHQITNGGEEFLIFNQQSLASNV